VELEEAGEVGEGVEPDWLDEEGAKVEIREISFFPPSTSSLMTRVGMGGGGLVVLNIGM
jgi:hypothetical protein